MGSVVFSFVALDRDLLAKLISIRKRELVCGSVNAWGSVSVLRM